MMAQSLEDDTIDPYHKDGEIRPDTINFNGSLVLETVITALFQSEFEEQTRESPDIARAEEGEYFAVFDAGKEVRHSVSRGYLTYITQSNKSNFSTAEFQGLDIRSNLVPTLEKIWSKRGNILQKSMIRNGDLIASALESLAIAVIILESSSASSIGDCEADYLSSTLSDLKHMRFEVDWLLPYIKKAVELHECKTKQDSLKKLAQLMAHATEQRSILLDQAAKFEEVEKKLEKCMTKLSEVAPYSEEADFDEPLGSGLT